MKIDYIFIAGSSGGHILPSISLINHLKNSKKRIIFFTNKEGLDYKNLIDNPYCKIKVFLQKRKIHLIFTQLITSIKYMFKNNNLKIVGFGGFISITPIFTFWISRLFLKRNKIYIHEQNIIYGSANKINYLFCDNSFISFPKINLKKKEIYLGNYFKKIPDPKKIIIDNVNSKTNILLIGGSAGSIELNNILMNFINTIPQNQIQNYQFDIQIPKIKNEYIKNAFNKKIVNVKFFNFRNDLNFDDYDLIFSRSGSGSLFEILYLTNKVNFIPHLHSRDNHQQFNKLFFKNKCNLSDNANNLLNLRLSFYFNPFINPYSIHKMCSFILD